LIKSIVLVADAYPPSRTSAALQLKDLAIEFLRQGITPTVITSDSSLRGLTAVTELDGISVLRLQTPEYKNIAHDSDVIFDDHIRHEILNLLAHHQKFIGEHS
jgi:hypothetical protein